LLHPRLVVMGVEASEVLRFQKASQAPTYQWRPASKSEYRGIPCKAHGEHARGCLDAPPRLDFSRQHCHRYPTSDKINLWLIGKLF
jgi:hypothetical protein